MPGPRLSIVVPFRDRRAMVRELLDALAAQTAADFEVVMVDDGSTDGARLEVQRDLQAGRPVRLVDNDGRGAYAARRTGVAASDAPYLAFTDSDCIPDREWVAEGLAALDKGADVANGTTVPTRPPHPLERTMWSGEEGLYPTSNVFYRRDAYDRAGGFDPGAADRFGFSPGSVERAMGFGEDTLLAWAVRRAGVAVHAGNAIVRHQVFPVDLTDTVRRTRMMRAFPALVREVPELRGGTLLRQGLLLNTPADRVPVYAALVAMIARRRHLALAGLAWWLGARLVEARRANGPVAARVAAVPVQMGLDVVATAALLRGSARHRTVVL
ncbi:MAG TPA: glycosyltransferase family A protein [Acidimicrobiales bacterium]|nr:glycosyltransferase family A protein [Acidimicrobiales bacterium]